MNQVLLDLLKILVDLPPLLVLQLVVLDISQVKLV